jgi:CHAT domain-containing protein
MPEMTLRPIVYLSACETALENGGSMELFSFASTLVRSGAGFVVGTMWSITDECGHMFARAFYRSLVTPTAAPEAFCTSLRQLISERSAMGTFAGVSMDHPIYWAGFVPVLGA